MAATNTAMSLVLCLLVMIICSTHRLLHPQPQLAATAASSSSSPFSSRSKIGKDIIDKTVSFTLYQQETMNRTGYVVVPGVDALAPAPARVVVSDAGEPSADRQPFGSMYVFRDNLTVRADSSSRVAGVAEGTSISTSFDGEDGRRSVSVAKITLHHRGYRGSVSILGGTPNITRPSVYPVVGGTDDFLYAVGYVRSSPVDTRGRTRTTYKMELRLYWPPHAYFAPIP
uniref:Dirigent protein n=1 Tax=Oryza meridionalis TaxID=40149 RepID=A0A0E0CB32_9ORYZ